jgi:predicted nucleic-acid-binding Zn-ribbon protein
MCARGSLDCHRSRLRYALGVNKHPICPKCDHNEILFVPEVRDSNYDTMALTTRAKLFASDNVVGVFSAYVCRGCGYTELFVHQASQINLADIPGAKILTGTKAPPYR